MKTPAVVHETHCKDCPDKKAVATLCENGVPYGYCLDCLTDRGFDARLMQTSELLLQAAYKALGYEQIRTG